MWVTNYFAFWAKFNAKPYDIPLVDFSAGTHWVFFSVGGSGGGGAFSLGQAEASQVQQFVAAVHAAGKKAILGTGGWGSDYTSAVTNRAASVASLVGLVNQYGFDGVDIDWEPVPTGQRTNFVAWMAELKTALGTKELLAAAFTFDQAVIDAQASLDQLNLMTYDMSGPWPGWVSWHNSPIYNGGKVFPSTGGPLPSIDGFIEQYKAAGVPASKLGFGVEFYGYVWNGAYQPEQDAAGMTVRDTVPYAEIMDTYEREQLVWDDIAKAEYFSLDRAGSSSDKFVSFDTERALYEKAAYVQSKGLGGVIIYEVSAGHRFGNIQPDRLLQAAKGAFITGEILPPPPPPPPPPPAPEPKLILVSTGGNINAGFANTSWGATATYANQDRGEPTIKVSYGDWGAFDILCGPTWGQETPIDSRSEEFLEFDIYPTSSFALDIAFYDAGGETVQVIANQWNHFQLRLPGTFTRFYFRRNVAGTAVAYFKNIRFTPMGGVVPVLSGAFNASPLTLPTGGGIVTLAWTSQNATGAMLDGVAVGVNGSQQVQITNSTSWVLVLTDGTSTVTLGASVSVAGIPPPPPPEEWTKWEVLNNKEFTDEEVIKMHLSGAHIIQINAKRSSGKRPIDVIRKK